jgi:maltose/moltooligosaccharide transporter
MKKPLLSLAQIINMSVGFLGIQFGFALQNGNASAILQNFGADVEHLSWFWLAAPLTGMIVQPIIGHFSDNTWTKLGRRRPFFLAGAILASTALLFMPNSASLASYFPPVMVGAVILMFMDASFNVSMEPFRALVADNLPDEQTTKGFSIQTVLIGIGAVVGSALPKIMVSWFGVSETAAKGQVADNVIYSFYVGALVFIVAIIWTIVTTKEYSPEERKSFGYTDNANTHNKQGLGQIFKDFANMPKMMLQLGAVQFFSWIALFSMWVYMTPAIAHHVFGTAINDGSSLQYRQAGSWVGVMFSVYNFIAMVYAVALPILAQKLGKRGTHAFNLICGGIGYISIYFATSQEFLLVSMVGVGMAWASILAMPYAILAPHIPSHKMGIYMGIFNFFITFPQITIGIVGGPLLKNYFQSNAIYAIIMSGIFMFLGAISVLIIQENKKA